MDQKRAKELLPVFTAFANGKKIESEDRNKNRWFNCPEPHWIEGVTYRIQREKKWYRVALCLSSIGYYTINADSESDYTESHMEQEDESFVRWLTPRIEYDAD